MKRFLVLAVFAFTGCDGSNLFGPEQTNVTGITGAWAYNATNLAATGVSCNVVGPNLSLNQSGNTFSGSMSGTATMTCSGGGQSSGETIQASGVVANGIIEGNTVSFDLGTPDWHHTGTLNGSSMSGTTTMRLDLGDPYGVIVLSGNFTVVRR